MESPDSTQPIDCGSMLRGFLVSAFCNVGCLAAGFMLVSIGIGAVIIAGFGLCQFGRLYPLWNSYRNEGKTETAKGVVVAAGITGVFRSSPGPAWATSDVSGWAITQKGRSRIFRASPF